MFTKLTEDRVLIKSSGEGDEKAFEMLLMRHKNKIYRFIGAKLNDPDLVVVSNTGTRFLSATAESFNPINTDV